MNYYMMNKSSPIQCPFCNHRYNPNTYLHHRVSCFRRFFYMNMMNSIQRDNTSTINTNINTDINTNSYSKSFENTNIHSNKTFQNNINQNNIHSKRPPIRENQTFDKNLKKYNIINESIKNEPIKNELTKKNNQDVFIKVIEKKTEQSIKTPVETHVKTQIEELVKKIENKTNNQTLDNVFKDAESKKHVQLISQSTSQNRSLRLDPDTKFVFHKDISYEEYLRDKRVIIVGPAPSVLKNTREFIEGFDVVVRLNKILPINEDLVPNIGRRTDILYNNLNLTDDPGKNRIPNSLLEKYEVKFVSCPYPPIQPFLPDIIYFLNQNRKRISFHHIPTAFYRKIENNLQTRPNTGLCAILDILRYPIKELYITGLTFFEDGYISQYSNVKDFNKFYKQMNSGIHKQSPQKEILQNMFLMDTRITVDETLKEILLRHYDTYQTNMKKLFVDSMNNVGTLYWNLKGQNVKLFKNDVNYFQIIENYKSNSGNDKSNKPKIYVNPNDFNDLTENDVLVLTHTDELTEEIIEKSKGVLLLTQPSQFWIDSLSNNIMSKVYVIDQIQFKKYRMATKFIGFHHDLSFNMFLIHLVVLDDCKIECSYFTTLSFSNNYAQSKKEMLFLRYLEKKECLFK